MTRSADATLEKYRDRYRDLMINHQAVPDPSSVYLTADILMEQGEKSSVDVLKIKIEGALRNSASVEAPVVSHKVFDTSDFTTVVRAAREAKKDFF